GLGYGREQRAEILGTGSASGADEPQHAHAQARDANLLDVKGEQADALAVLFGGENAQALLGAVKAPPLVEPGPGVEDARRLRLLVQAIPLHGEAGELGERARNAPGDLRAGRPALGRHLLPRMLGRRELAG